MAELFIGVMSGTSMDAVDAVLVDFDGPPRTVARTSRPFPPDLHARLTTLVDGGAAPIAEVMELDVEVGRLFARAANAVIEQARVARRDIRAIGSHGQTVWHHPRGDTPFTAQFGDPNVIAEVTGLTTVADFRRRDVAAGGEGAPLAAAFHRVLFRSPDEDRVILNIGGIANATFLPRVSGAAATGFDTGPGNTLMDAWVCRHLGQRMDEDGRWAAGGRVLPDLLSALLADPYFHEPPPKSTGREYFNLAWLNRALQTLSPAPDTRNVQATLCELSAATIADGVRTFVPSCQRVLACGGGTRNGALMGRLRALLGGACPVQTTRDYGIEPEWVEAVTFAWLAKQTLECRAVDLRSITGSRHPVVLGGIYQSGGRYQTSDFR